MIREEEGDQGGEKVVGVIMIKMLYACMKMS
jgi:hypothetical protein